MISIIVPVYNVERVIERCIKSIISQTYSNWELILVDDGSQDCSKNICDDYAQKDNRIKVFHQKNQGPSAARNAGIKAAKGEQLCFIDSDDYVGPNYLADFSCGDETDLVVQGLKLVYTNGRDLEEYKPANNFTGSMSMALKDASIYVLLYGPCCKLFKTSIIRDFNILFPLNVHYGEDRIFVLSYMAHCEKTVELISVANYIYTHENISSLTSKRKKSIELAQSSILQFMELMNLKSKMNINDYCLYYRKELMLDTYQSVYNNIIENKFKIWNIISYIRLLDNELLRFVYKEKEIPRTFKIIKYLIKLSRIGI